MSMYVLGLLRMSLVYTCIYRTHSKLKFGLATSMGGAYN